VIKRKRRRALIAAREGGGEILGEMLEDSFDIVVAYTMAEAFHALRTDRPQVDLIVATLAFDDSRMIEFLQAVKRDRNLRHIPFFCCRVVQGIVTDRLTGKMAAICKECGAEDFVDVANLPRDAATKTIKAMLAGGQL
jgi:CheY-like chemotaxis protein